MKVSAEVEFELEQVVYSRLEPDYTYSIRAHVLRKGEASYLCFNPEYGEVEFQAHEITDQRSVF